MADLLPSLSGWPGDVVALIITFVAIQALVLVNGAVQERRLLPTYVTRKIIHMFAAPIYVVCWLLFQDNPASRWIAALVPLAFIIQFTVIGLGLRKDDAFVNSMSRSGNPRELLGGTLHYAIVMLVCTALFFESGGAGAPINPVALLILGALAGGDGLADMVGRRYGGKMTFGVGGATKSVAGSGAMFAGSVLMSLALAAVFTTAGPLDLGALLLPLLILSALATVVEAFTPKGLDNYTISLAVLVGILLLAALNLWPFGAILTL